MPLRKRNKLVRRPTDEDCYNDSRIRISVSVTTSAKRTVKEKLIIIFFDRNAVYLSLMSIYIY